MTRSKPPEATPFADQSRSAETGRYRDPSLQYPPSRPTWRMLLAAATVVIVAIVILNWSRLSAAGPINRIEAGIEHATGL